MNKMNQDDLNAEHNHPLPRIAGIPDFVYKGMQTPKTILQAKEQIINLEVGMNSIRDQLDYTPGNREWRERASSALRIYESKSKILKRWIAIAENHTQEINQKRLLHGYYALVKRVDKLEQQLAALQES